MKRITALAVISVLMFTILSCKTDKAEKPVIPGAWQIGTYSDVIRRKSVAIVANQTSMVGDVHLVDTLLRLGFRISAIFAPEHGFRDLADAGDLISDGKDPVTGIRILSLYGSHQKPTPEDLEGIDIVLFDIQDVGVRFYTYISTLHYVMEACGENGVKFVVLDRPNPNGFYIDGNIADTTYRSFVGLDPVPVVHGMTPGEYAMMLNGERWLRHGIICDLEVIKCLNYDHKTYYELPVKPSPNLPDQNSIYLYPSTCWFEGTNISLGRGTHFPFQVFGSPLLPDRGFSFTPASLPGAKNPPLLGQKCFGTDLRKALTDSVVPAPLINLEWLLDAYNDYPEKENFFIPYFDVLASGPQLREQIQKGMTQDEIRASWREGLEKFGRIRDEYLLYDKE